MPLLLAALAIVLVLLFVSHKFRSKKLYHKLAARRHRDEAEKHRGEADQHRKQADFHKEEAEKHKNKIVRNLLVYIRLKIWYIFSSKIVRH